MKVYKGQQADYVSALTVVFTDGRHVQIKMHGTDPEKVNRISDYIEYCLKEDWINDPDLGVL